MKYKIVPVEPDETMITHGACAEDPEGLYTKDPLYEDGVIAREVYEFMLAAAPDLTEDPALVEATADLIHEDTELRYAQCNALAKKILAAIGRE